MLRFLAFFFLFLTLAFLPAIAQPPLSEVTHYGEDRGFMAQTPIVDVQTDSENNIWILAFRSIHKYDGQSFQRLTNKKKKSGACYRFYENQVGVKYVIDHLGQVFFIEGDSLRSYPLNDTLRRKAGNKLFTDVHYDTNKTLHIAYKHGVYLVIDSNYTIREPFKERKLDLAGIVCIFRKDRDPFVVKPKASSKETPYNFYLMDEEGEIIGKHPMRPHSSPYHHSATQLVNGNYLFSGLNNPNLLVEFDQSGKIQQIPFHAPIQGLFADKHGGVWISSDTDDELFYYPNGTISEENRYPVMPGRQGIASAEDFQGGIWVFSQEYGLNRIGHPSAHFFNKQSGIVPTNFCRAVEPVGQKLYLSRVGDEFNSINRNTYQLKDHPLPGSHRHVKDFYYDQEYDRLWAGFRDGLCYIEKDSLVEITSEKIGMSTKAKMYFIDGQPQSDSISVACYYGNQFILMQDTVVKYLSRNYPDQVHDVLVLGDSIWVATNRAIYIETPESSIIFSERFPQFSGAFNLTFFNNQIWIYSISNHLFLFDNDSLVAVKYRNQQLKNLQMVLRNEDEFWGISPAHNFLFSRNGPINHPSGTRLSAYGTIPNCGKADVANTDSSVFFATANKGVLEVGFDAIKKRPQQEPYLRISSVKVNGEFISLVDSLLELTYEENVIQVSYICIDYNTPNVEYRYRMGKDEGKWLTTKERELQFISLPPGRYTLEIQGKSFDQLFWSSSKILRFTIDPPFWQRWWFIVLVTTLAIATIFIIANYRNSIKNREKDLSIKRLDAEQKMLQAKMDPHFLFNVIASLQYLLGSGKNEKASLFLDKFSAIMRNTLYQISKEYITLEKEISFLTEYLELERIRLEERFDFHFQLDDALQLDREIPNFMIQPIVENAIHHGLKNKPDLGVIKISFSRTSSFLQVVVEDDGVGYESTTDTGFDKKRQRKSYGIGTIKERLLLYNGKNAPAPIVVESGKGSGIKEGTKVTVLIKLIK